MEYMRQHPKNLILNEDFCQNISQKSLVENKGKRQKFYSN